MYACKHVNTSYHQPTGIWLDAFFSCADDSFLVTVAPQWPVKITARWRVAKHHSFFTDCFPLTPALMVLSYFAMTLLAHYCIKLGWIIKNLHERLHKFISAQKQFSDLSFESHIKPRFRLERFYQASSLTTQFSLWGGVSLSELEAWGWRLRGVRGWRRGKIVGGSGWHRWAYC